MSWLPRFIRRERSAASVSARPRLLELYTRDGCHLCDEMKVTIRAAGLGERVELREVNIAGDPALEEAYGRSIPVLTIDGRVAFKGRLTAEELEGKLDRYGREASSSARESSSSVRKAGGAT